MFNCWQVSYIIIFVKWAFISSQKFAQTSLKDEAIQARLYIQQLEKITNLNTQTLTCMGLSSILTNQWASQLWYHVKWAWISQKLDQTNSMDED